MSANCLFSDPFIYAFDADGNPLVGAKFTFFQAGSSTPLPVFTDPSLAVAWSQPVTTGAAGISTGPVYVSPTPAIKIVAVDANDVALNGYPLDFWSPSAVAS